MIRSQKVNFLSSIIKPIPFAYILSYLNQLYNNITYI